MVGRQSKRVLALLAIAVIFAAGTESATAAEDRRVQFTSAPAGANVYQLKGFKRELLGQTPLTHTFPVRSRQTVVRVAVERSGFEPRLLEVDDQTTTVDVDLVAIPLVGSAGGNVQEQRLLRSASALNQRREAVLEALAPWAPLEPAAPVDVADRTFLQLRLTTGGRSQRPVDAAAIATRVAEVLDGAPPAPDLDGLLLSFERRVRGGVTTSVGTRYVTEMVCEGAMVPTSVWDSCATRSATTSTTSYGTQTTYKCVGGSVTRSVYNSCARQVPRQKAVVDLKTETRSDVRTNATLEVIAWGTDPANRVGYCEFRNGKLVSSAGTTSSSLVDAICRRAN